MLRADEVHVWHLGADDRTAANVSEEWMVSLLNPEERARRVRFLFAADRDRFLLARAALRSILARYTGTPAAALAFRFNAYGRPEIEAPDSADAIRFNLSHTSGAVAVAVCRRYDVGVDVERNTRQVHDVARLARRFFSPAEARALELSPPERRSDRFFQYWTLKESYVKARGRGFSLPLDRFSFDLEDSMVQDSVAYPRITIDPVLNDDAREWRFLLARVAPDHTLAAAVRCGGEARFVLQEATLSDLVGPLRT